MDACIVTSGTGNAFPKDTGNSQAKEEGIGLGEVLGRVTVQVFVREHCTMIAASVQCDSDGIPKGSHDVLLKRANGLPCSRRLERTTVMERNGVRALLHQNIAPIQPLG